MKTYAVYLAVLVACSGLLASLEGMETGMIAALVICLASLGLSYLVVDLGRRLGWITSIGDVAGD